MRRSAVRRSAAFAAGTLFMAGWALGEGLYQVCRLPGLTPGLGLRGLAGTAPLWPVAGLLAAAIHESWRHFLGVEAPLRELSGRLRAWMSPADGTSALRRAAWILALLLALSLWSSATVALGARVAAAVRTPAFVVASILAVSGAVAALLMAALPVLLLPLERTLRTLSRGRPALQRWATPGRALAVASLLALAGLAVAATLHRETMVHLPWGLPIGLASGVALAAAGARLTGRSVDARLAAVGLLAATALFWWIGRSPGAHRSAFMQTSGLIAAAHHLLPVSAAWGSDEDEEQEGAADLGRYSEGRPSYPLPADVHRRPHILLVTTDSLSFAHTSLGGYHRDTTPHLAAWAQRATVFSSAFSLSAATRTAFPGLLAGIFNAQAPLEPARTPPHPYASGMRTMAALLKGLGYRTVHIPGDRFFLQGGRGWHTVGFEVVDDTSLRAKDPIHTAQEVTDAAIAYMDAQPRDRPLFLWVHYFDHHIPFRLGPGVEPFDEGRSKVDLYDAELRFADKHWGRLLAHVERTWQDWQHLTVFTADHGESFDANHPEKHHSGSIYTSVLHVPLVIQAAQGRGRTIAGLVSHADILPTIANLVGIEPIEGWVGSSLAAVLYAGAEPERAVQYALRFAPEAFRSPGGGYLELGVRTDEHYLLVDLMQGTSKLVDWRRDLLERTDLSARLPDERTRLQRLARRKLAWIKARECGLRHPHCL